MVGKMQLLPRELLDIYEIFLCFITFNRWSFLKILGRLGKTFLYSSRYVCTASLEWKECIISRYTIPIKFGGEKLNLRVCQAFIENRSCFAQNTVVTSSWWKRAVTVFADFFISAFKLFFYIFVSFCKVYFILSTLITLNKDKTRRGIQVLNPQLTLRFLIWSTSGQSCSIESNP